MSRVRMFLVAMSLVPTTALAHSAYDPNLHVGSRYDQCWVQFAPELTQDAFARFAREFGSVSAFKPMAPGTTLGKRRVEIGLQYLAFSVDDKSDAWNDTFAHPNHDHPLGSTQTFPEVKVRAGVTDRIDVGAFFTRNYSSNYGWLGLDVKYGLLQQNEQTPVSLAVRAAYTRTLYVQDMNMNAFTVDAAVARTFWNRVTPYAGVGGDLVMVHETSSVVNLHDETQFVPSALGGVELRWGHLGFVAEGHLSAVNSLQMQISGLF